MKLQSNNLLETLTIQEFKKLTTEVKETLATNFKKENQKNFTSAELWNIQRQKKNIFSRREYF